MKKVRELEEKENEKERVMMVANICWALSCLRDTFKAMLKYLFISVILITGL